MSQLQTIKMSRLLSHLKNLQHDQRAFLRGITDHITITFPEVLIVANFHQCIQGKEENLLSLKEESKLITALILVQTLSTNAIDTKSITTWEEMIQHIGEKENHMVEKCVTQYLSIYQRVCTKRFHQQVN